MLERGNMFGGQALNSSATMKPLTSMHRTYYHRTPGSMHLSAFDGLVEDDNWLSDTLFLRHAHVDANLFS